MGLDEAHGFAVMAEAARYEPPREALQEAAQDEGIEGLSLEDAAIDIDVPIPLIAKVDAWARLTLQGKNSEPWSLLVELWGEAFDRSYGARVQLLGKPGLVVYVTPTEEQNPPVGQVRWARGVAALSEQIGRTIPPEGLMRALSALWPESLVDIWQALVTRY